MEANLDTAKRIIGSFTINVNEYPEYLKNNSCERNHLVAQCILAIDELKKGL